MTAATDFRTFGAAQVVPILNVDEWHLFRRHGLGASDIAAAVGLSRYETPASLWLKKTGQIGPTVETPVMALGHVLESYTLERFTDETGIVVGIDDRQLAVYNVDVPWIRATLDAVTPDGDLVETKTTANRELLVEPSDEYLLQCQWQMAATGAALTYLAVLNRTNGDFAVHEVERNQTIIDGLIEAGREFWRLVETNTPPPVDGLAPTSEALRRIPAEPGTTVELDAHADTVQFFREVMRNADDKVKHWQEQRDMADNAIRLLIGNAETATIGGEVFATYKTQTSKAYQVAAKTYRVLRYKKEKTANDE